MPLFGKHKHDNTAVHEDRYDPQHEPAVAGNQQQRVTGVGEGYSVNPSTQGTHPGPHGQTQHGIGQPHLNQYNAGANTRTAGYAPDEPIASNRAGVGAGANVAGTGNGNDTGTGMGVPPAAHVNTSDGTRSGGGGRRLEGKAERAVGSLIGSQALKERGVQKEQEAGAFKMQSAEIAEAERLEKEALMRRERAVGHGAHPDNRHLGGMQNANTLSDLAANQSASGGQMS